MRRPSARLWRTAAILASCLTVSCLDDPVDLGGHDDYLAQLELIWNQYDRLFVGFVYTGAVDWDEVFEEYSARTDTVTTQASFIYLMSEMLSELEDAGICLVFAGDPIVPWQPDVEASYDWDVLWQNYLEPAGFEWFEEGWWGYCVMDSVPYILIAEWNDMIYGGYLDEVLAQHPDAPAVVIDQRPCGGGSVERIGQVARRFNDQTRIAYYTLYRKGPGREDLSEPEPRHVYTLPSWYEGPVAVLIGEDCYGAPELFACMADELPNAVLIGDTTMSEVTTPAVYALPGGSSYSVPVETILRADSSSWLQVTGVAPDIFVPATPEDFAAGRDPILEFALLWARGAGPGARASWTSGPARTRHSREW
ncbi:hypothetical protein JW921_00895 [Candidatus Fermentibacterales bacterium]|nr:hypothetical protein [Candidatus Fermentibacterales bacterium]